MNPLDYQRKLMNEYAEKNEIAQKNILKNLEDGKQITYWSNISGPYINHKTYYFSNGESFDIIEPASLHWWIPINFNF